MPQSNLQRKAAVDARDKYGDIVLNCMQKFGQPITSPGVADELDIQDGWARRLLIHLMGQGKVRVVGSIEHHDGKHIRSYQLYEPAL